MLNQAHVTTQHTTFLAPVVPVAAPLPFHELPYSPSLLLSLPDLSSALVCNHEFVTACEYGYDGYFEEMYTSDLVFQQRNYTPSELSAFLHEELASSRDALHETTLAWRVGFVFGWLSAFSKYQPALVKHGLRMMVWFVRERNIHS